MKKSFVFIFFAFFYSNVFATESYITVQIEPEVAVIVGATWRINNTLAEEVEGILNPDLITSWNSSNDTITVQGGSFYIIEVLDISQSLPSHDCKKILPYKLFVRSSQTVMSTADYECVVSELSERVSTTTPDSGSISVTISPQSVNDKGAMWKVVGFNIETDWFESGKKVEGLEFGTYRIEFKVSTPGCNAPENQVVNLDSLSPDISWEADYVGPNC
ncbi:hypothetical protein [Glaciecola sp. MF2-115]|uniref:hypothetical protein n=1 Tax=Glaciecola sp. MF2-115 TaxID=3384827 RepID=UPI0039A18527